MRLVLALLLLLAAPAMAADWGHYTNVRFGYAIDVPPGFAAQGESDNSDGEVFRAPTATLTVFGGNILDGDFESEVRTRQAFATGDGWAITYQVSTPQKASFSGRKGARILYARMVALCGGTAFAMFTLEYGRADLERFNPVVDRLVFSLRPTEGAC